MFFELVATFLIMVVVVLLLWLLRGAMLVPVPTDRSEKISIVVRVEGGCSCLEQTIRGLEWLAENNTLSGEIVIIDAGMDEETRRIAALISASNEHIILVLPEGICRQR